jgi:hypothetical protein
MQINGIKLFFIALSTIFLTTAYQAFAMEYTDKSDKVENTWRPNTTLLFGNEKSGKSTFAHLLLGKTLTVKNKRFFALGEHSIPNIEIFPYNSSQVTEKVALVFDSNKKRIIVDCPPFRERSKVFAPNNKELPKEFALENAETIYDMLKGNVNIILLVMEHDISLGHGLQLCMNLTTLTELFEKQDELQQLLSIVITHGTGRFTSPEALSKVFLNNPKSQLGEREKDLLKFLIDNDRIGFFLRPDGITEKLYEVPENLKMFINADRPYVKSPSVIRPFVSMGTYCREVLEGYW